MLRSFTGSAQGVHEACMRGARRANAARAAVRDGTEGVGERRTRMQKKARREAAQLRNGCRSSSGRKSGAKRG